MAIVDELVFFIVEVRLKAEPRQKGATFRLLGRWSWLAVDEGYPSHTSTKSRAHRFAKKPDADEISAFDGKPWRDAHDTRYRPRITRVTETRAEERMKETD